MQAAIRTSAKTVRRAAALNRRTIAATCIATAPLNTRAAIPASCSRRLFSCTRTAAASPAAACAARPAAPAAATVDSSRVHPNTKQASLQFARWLAQHGVRFSSGDDPRPMFGLKRSPTSPAEWILSTAARPISKGEVLCRLPLGLTLSPDSPIRSPLATLAAASGSSSAASASPLLPIEVEAGSELLSMIDRIPATLWPLKGGLRLLFEFALQSGSRSQATAPTGSKLPGANETQGSFYTPYIHLLPNSFPSIPLFWSPAQVAALQYEPLASQLKLRSAFLRNKSAELATHVHLFGAQVAELTTPERLAWAMSCVSSRAFQLRPDVSYCTSLPLIDMMNHSYDNNCKVVFEVGPDGSAATPPPPSASFDEQLRFAQQTLQVVAVRDIPPHTELTLNYGHHSNDHFLLNYGFLLDDNPADVLECKRDAEALEVAADMAGEKVTEWAASPAWKKVIAREAGVSIAANAAASSASSLVLPFRVTRDQLDPHLIALVHVMLAPPDEPRPFAHFLERAVGEEPANTRSATDKEGASALDAQRWSPVEQDLSKQPAAVLRILYSYLSLLQSSFATTLAQDVEALGQIVTTIVTAAGSDRGKEEAVEREELAIRFRIGKKRIVGEQMRRAQKAMGQVTG